jgi:hypothetical protein
MPDDLNTEGDRPMTRRADPPEGAAARGDATAAPQGEVDADSALIAHVVAAVAAEDPVPQAVIERARAAFARTPTSPPGG